MWLRKNKPKTSIPIIYLCAGIVATMPSITRSATQVFPSLPLLSFKNPHLVSLHCFLLHIRFAWYKCVVLIAEAPSVCLIKLCICSYLRRGLGWHFPEVVGFELFTSLMMAFTSWQLFAACQRPSSWVANRASIAGQPLQKGSESFLNYLAEILSHLQFPVSLLDVLFLHIVDAVSINYQLLISLL